MKLITPELIFEGIHMFQRHLRVRGKHFKRLGKQANSICKKILKELYTGYFFQTSLGNYQHFYSRDFGMVTKSLLELGYRKEVESTLEYAMTQYQERNHIKTFITVLGKPVDFPNVYSPDSTAYMLYALRLANNKDLIEKYKPFLQQEVNKFYDVVVDKKTGLVKQNTHFGGMRDYSKRDASCYDTVMCAVVQREATLLGLKNPLIDYDYKKLLMKYYWTGSYFRDDASSNTLTADANIYPFWLGIIDDKKILETVIKSMQEEGLDKPFPIKYVSSTSKKGRTIGAEIFVPNWEANSIWPMSGLPFIDIVSKVDKQLAKKYLQKYKEQIEKYGTFIEVYDKKGKPYKSLFFSADEGMIWCANYLYLDNLLNKK